MSYVASGITGASPIWRRAMDLLLKIYPSSGFSPPTSIARLATCAGKSDYFLAGTLPPPCPSPTPTGTPKPEVQPTPDILTGASTEIYNKPKLKNPRLPLLPLCRHVAPHPQSSFGNLRLEYPSFRHPPLCLLLRNGH